MSAPKSEATLKSQRSAELGFLSKPGQLGFFVAANAAAFGQGSLLLHGLIVLNLEQAQVHNRPRPRFANISRRVHYDIAISMPGWQNTLKRERPVRRPTNEMPKNN